MQRYFCRRDSVFARFAGMHGGPHDWYYGHLEAVVIPNIARLLEVFRARRGRIVFTEFGSGLPDGADLPLWARRHNDLSRAVLGTACYPPLADPSARVIDELAPRDGELVVPKTTSGPLAGTDVDARLRALGVGSVVVTGVATDVCVTGMSRELADAGFDVQLVADACATPLKESHDWALRLLGATFATLVKTDDLVAAGGARDAVA
jgi:nicotinamidase-related amidase